MSHQTSLSTMLSVDLFESIGKNVMASYLCEMVVLKNQETKLKREVKRQAAMCGLIATMRETLGSSSVVLGARRCSMSQPLFQLQLSW